MTRCKIYELIDGERDHLNSKEEAIAKWDRRASAERVKELEQQVAELQGDIDDLRTWSDEAATVLTRGLELMPLDQLRQWQGAAAIQQAYYDVVRREEATVTTEPFAQYNALTSLLTMLDYAEAVGQRSNEELAQILIDQVWAELPLDSAAAAFVGEVAYRLAPSLFESADLEREWPQMPDLEGVDIFPHLPISGHTERHNDD